jgi:hypothetical protein
VTSHKGFKRKTEPRSSSSKGLAVELVAGRPLCAHQLANQGTLVPRSACAETAEFACRTVSEPLCAALIVHLHWQLGCPDGNGLRHRRRLTMAKCR